ncbi:protein kinase [Streptomyces hirsutus]|uniref:Protein kinase n=1 Tax=Streptomyces hirsutus TaxID=35620 RepID=A0ABZ1GUP6_9ACTN|nr:protein kinase [Streptomyces hirsutus]WSD08468.1 protein kinase [Streptomyces hirsutus]
MTEPYAVTVPKGYRVGVWEVREPIATGAFGSVYAARRTGEGTEGGDGDGKTPRGPGAGDPGGGTGKAPTGCAGTGTRDRSGYEEALPRSVALKFLPTGTGTPRQLSHLRELVEREVELLRRISRPRLIRMYETLTVDDPGRPALDGATVLVLERAEGSLSALLAASPRPGTGPALLAQICEGLVQLHRAGWVHGDLKPANVLLMADGSARLADFNMAAELEGTHAYTSAFATPDYTPPELLRSEIGERGRRIRPSADVWAFGVLAHLVLTGTFPLPGATPTVRRDAAAAYARGTDELRLSPALPDAWRDVVHACLARTHEDRITGETLLRRVRTAADTDRPPHRRWPRPSPLSRRPRGRRLSRRLRSLPGLRRSRRGVLAPVVAAGAAVAALVVLAVLGALGYGVGPWAGGSSDGGAQGTAGTANVGASSYGADELRTDRGIPPAYRLLIVETAHDCGRKDVTPVLLAAMLKVESDFDPDLSDPVKDEYGIARWTPSVLRWWMNADGTPGETVPEPPFPPAESIPAMGRYLCWIAPRLEPGLPTDPRLLLAAAYRTSYRKVNDAGGVPPNHRAYADRVARYLKEYTPPAGK